MLGMDFSRLRSLVEATYGLSLGSGRVFFVGSSTDRWFVEEMVNQKTDGTVRTSLVSAAASCEAGRGDVIVVLPGTHTLTAPLSPAAGTRIVGLPDRREVTVVDAKAATQWGSITAANVLIQGLTIRPVNGVNGCVTNDNMVVKDCVITAVSGTALNGIGLDGATGNASVGARVIGCQFQSDLTEAIKFVSDANDQIFNVVIEDCIIASATTGIKLPTDNYEEVIVRNCVFSATTNPLAITAAKTATGSMVVGCSFAATTGGKADICGGTAWPASSFYVNNTTLAGLSVAAPA